MRTVIHSILLLLSIFNLCFCHIEVTPDCSLKIDNLTATDLEEFTRPKNVENGAYGRVLTITSKKYPHCVYAVKEIRFIKNQETLKLSDKSGTAVKKSYKKENLTLKYVLENNAQREMYILKILPDIPFFPKYYGSLEENKGNTTKCSIIMEFVKGESLQKLIKEKLLTEDEMKVIAAKLAIAIEKLHSMKIVHRDVKPANVIYSIETERLVLVDFGFSIQLDSIDSEMSTRNGTPKYMAEEVLNIKKYDYTVDWYSYGATLLIMFGGEIDVINKTQNGINRDVKTIFYENLDESQNFLVHRCLEPKETRVRNLADLKGHAYFKNLKWSHYDVKFRKNKGKQKSRKENFQQTTNGLFCCCRK